MFKAARWSDHLASLDWKQGEHILISAPTGAGKTTLAQDLVQRRGHVITFATKPYDPTLTREFKDWAIVREYKEIEPWMNRVIVWPKGEKTTRGTLLKHRRVFGEAFDAILRARGWCVLVDETHYMSDRAFVGAYDEIALLHHVGRSSGISMVTLTQRPSWIPKIIYSSASHAYIARTTDKTDLKRLADLGGIDPTQVANAVAALPSKWDYLYLNPTGSAEPVAVNRRR